MIISLNRAGSNDAGKNKGTPDSIAQCLSVTLRHQEQLL